MTSSSSPPPPPSLTSSPWSALIGGSSSQQALKNECQVFCVRRSWTGGGLSDVHVEESSSPAGLIYHCTKLSAPPGQGSPLSQPAPHSLARLLTHRPANLISQMFLNQIHSTDFHNPAETQEGKSEFKWCDVQGSFLPTH